MLGVAGNMDQFLNMEALVRAGVGQMIRADRIDPEHLRVIVRQMLGDSAMRNRALRFVQSPAFDSTAASFLTALDAIQSH